MTIALAIIIGVALGVMVAWVSHRSGWRFGLALAIAYAALVCVLTVTTSLSSEAAVAAMLAFAAPNIVDGVLTDRGRTTRSAH